MNLYRIFVRGHVALTWRGLMIEGFSDESYITNPIFGRINILPFVLVQLGKYYLFPKTGKVKHVRVRVRVREGSERAQRASESIGRYKPTGLRWGSKAACFVLI